MIAIALLLLVVLLPYTKGDFTYTDFNSTAGLALNGAADVTDCGEQSKFVEWNSTTSDENDNNITKLHQISHTATNDLSTIIETVNDTTSNEDITADKGIFGHRHDGAVSTNTGCSSRIRLTPSHPSKAGSVWYETRVPVLKGFETNFSWKITDHSVECTRHVDADFATLEHESCAVHGGDGFAFVIHADPADASALGGDGEQLGYGGIRNSVAVEFDTWTNVDTQQSDDVFQDHISIHSGGPSSPNNSNQHTALGYWRAHDIADGKVHKAKVQYLPYVEERYFELLTANENLLPYLKDNGEGRRLGTLAVFVDQGIVEDKPLLAVPVNLSLLLDLPQSLAYVGFTASTGRKWEKHDILSWEWCHSDGCHGDPSERLKYEAS